MKPVHCATRILAFFLSLSLTLLNSALALRVENGGLEERTPIVQTIEKLLRGGPSQRSTPVRPHAAGLEEWISVSAAKERIKTLLMQAADQRVNIVTATVVTQESYWLPSSDTNSYPTTRNGINEFLERMTKAEETIKGPKIRVKTSTGKGKVSSRRKWIAESKIDYVPKQNLLMVTLRRKQSSAPAAGLEERVVVEGLPLPRGGLEFHGLTAGLEDGNVVVPHSPKILAILEPGRTRLIIPKAGLKEVTRIFRHPSIDLQASVVEALGEKNVIDLPKTLNEIPAFWKEWDLEAGDVVVVDLPESEVRQWLPTLQLPEGVAVLNLPHTQAAGLNLSDWAAMVNAALKSGGILPRIQSVVQSGLQEAVVLDMGV